MEWKSPSASLYQCLTIGGLTGVIAIIGFLVISYREFTQKLPQELDKATPQIEEKIKTAFEEELKEPVNPKQQSELRKILGEPRGSMNRVVLIKLSESDFLTPTLIVEAEYFEKMFWLCIAGIAICATVSLLGASFWYFRVQRPTDHLLREQLRKAARENQYCFENESAIWLNTSMETIFSNPITLRMTLSCRQGLLLKIPVSTDVSSVAMRLESPKGILCRLRITISMLPDLERLNGNCWSLPNKRNNRFKSGW